MHTIELTVPLGAPHPGAAVVKQLAATSPGLQYGLEPVQVASAIELPPKQNESDVQLLQMEIFPVAVEQLSAVNVRRSDERFTTSTPGTSSC